MYVSKYDVKVDIYLERYARGISRDYFETRIIEVGLQGTVFMRNFGFSHESSGGRACYKMSFAVYARSTDEAEIYALQVAKGYGVNQAYAKRIIKEEPVSQDFYSIAVKLESDRPLSELEALVDYEIEVCNNIHGATVDAAYSSGSKSSMVVRIAYTKMAEYDLKSNISGTLKRKNWITKWSWYIAGRNWICDQSEEHPKVDVSPRIADEIVEQAEALLETVGYLKFVEVINEILNIDLDPNWYKPDGVIQLICLIVTKRFGTDSDIAALKEAVAMHYPLCDGDYFNRSQDGNTMTCRGTEENGTVTFMAWRERSEVECLMTFPSVYSAWNYLNEGGYNYKEGKHANECTSS
jgi:hypothetical protein